MKPLLVYVLEATSGGAKRHVVDALTGLAQRGWDCLLAYSLQRADAAFADELRSLHRMGVRSRRVDMAAGPLDLRNLSAVILLSRTIRRVAPAGRRVIVHGHASIGGACARLVAALLRASHVPAVACYTPHTPSTQFPHLGRLRRAAYYTIECALARCTKAIIAVGRDEFAHMNAWPAGRCRRIHIPNGIRGPIGTTPGSRQGWLWVGRFSVEKNPLAAIDLLAASPGQTLTMAGDGPLAAAAHEHAVTLGVTDRLRLLGYVRDPHELYQRASCLLLTSEYEGLPYAALEAMATGCPVAGLAAPGVTPLLASTGNLVLPRTSPSEQGALLVAWLERHGSIASIRNSEIVSRSYTVERMADRLDRLYRTLWPNLAQSGSK